MCSPAVVPVLALEDAAAELDDPPAVLDAAEGLEPMEVIDPGSPVAVSPQHDLEDDVFSVSIAPDTEDLVELEETVSLQGTSSIS